MKSDLRIQLNFIKKENEVRDDNESVSEEDIEETVTRIE